MKIFSRVPVYVLNGMAVALGLGCIQLLIGALAGAHAAQLALSGALCASLADVPNTLPRTWRRVATAATLSFFAAIAVTLLDSYPVALGFGVAGVAFVAMMMMAWGVRAAAVSFAPILSLIFSMAAGPDAESLEVLALWNAAGGAAYLAWSVLAGAVLQRRYRTLVLANALRAAADLLRARAGLLMAAPGDAEDATPMRTWVANEAVLADALQAARDFSFAAPDSPRARRDIAMLLRAIDLRDVLLASRLDLDLLGRDAGGRWLLQRIADNLRRIGEAMDGVAQRVREGRRGMTLSPSLRAPRVAAPSPSPGATPAARQSRFHDVLAFCCAGFMRRVWRAAPEETGITPLDLDLDLDSVFADAPMAAGDTRRRLLPGLSDRLRRLCSDVTHMQALLGGGTEDVPLSRDELRRFVAPEGWPLSALRAQLSWRSPVLRHALRASLALGCAYFIGLALPWASHPHWLVLSVAVVLRGNLEQTLSRRNARVLGTLFGCGVVVALSHAQSPALLDAIFLTAVGTGHAFAVQRYWLTATAGTVMALLQAHMIYPAGGFAIAERVADTVLGAALAWGFSYVLPSWERRSLPDAIANVLKEISEYAHHALVLRSPDPVAQRLARRRAYDALSAMAGALQRSAAEPRYVRIPVQEVAAVLDRGQRLMAHLSLVRLMLADRAAEWDSAPAVQALTEAHAVVAALLDHSTQLDPALGRADPGELSLLPMDGAADDVMPWLQRRLQVLVHDARMMREADMAAMEKLK